MSGVCVCVCVCVCVFVSRSFLLIGTLHGPHADIDDNFALYKPENCSYPSTDDDDGDPTKLGLTVLCVRLGFLIFFENVRRLPAPAPYLPVEISLC